MMKLLILAFEFFKTGLFAVGGGLATLPFLTRMQEQYGWFTASELANMIAISESTPGPIGVNMATYVGYSYMGVIGGLVATLSLVLPSVIVIIIIAGALDKYQNSSIIQNAFAFLRPAVAGLIAAAGFSVMKIALFKDANDLLHSVDLIAVVLFILLFACTQIKKLKSLHPIVYIIVGAIVGIVLKMG